MKYNGEKLNAIQEERVINEYFDESFSEGIQGELESFINKKMEDTENNFLMYNESDIDGFIAYHKTMVELGIQLKNRDFSTEKFKDNFYTEK